MEITRHDQEEVYDSSRSGDVEYLNRLIEKDTEILRRISLQTGKTGTPLHVSALLGHAEFTKALCTKNPKLAERVDADGRTPLHLASAEGHKETVEALLSVYADACLRCDEKGRIPLHYAAMNGEVEVLQKLIDKNPESIYVKVENRSKETVLHLCIKHNQLECLKRLVERDDSNGEFLNSRAGCDGGVTILHLALMLRQIKTIRYLLSVDAIRAEATGVNGISLTMSDILEYSSVTREDFSRSLEIQQILMDAGLIRRENNENDNPNSDVAAAAVVAPNPRRVKKKKKLHKRVASSEKGSTPARRCWIKLMEWLRYPSNWVVDTRGMLMVVATMISTMTFQAIVNPPGGVWETNNTDTDTTIDSPGINYSKTICTEQRTCMAGTAVLGYIWEDLFVDFINYNTISFLASLSVTLLLISGFPLHNRFCMWLLSLFMCVTLTFLAFTYLQVLLMIVPPYFDFSYISIYFNSNISIYSYSVYLWNGLLAIVGAIHTIRFLIWVTKWLRCMYFRSRSCLKNMTTTGSFSCNDATRFEEIDATAVV
ncbi:serine/threonine-protein phosphatase 6 regulatory ankyrin repeat subunit A-like [Pyrus x bretschneideri]|uniref:serine/threonine-protein phosphatase 6 regulatory ankyrin repeat subunit A-like n=1 Tax=Pyrus x bretschneideri TaxID=225117 RepID=UPI00202F30C2|nr:serine/threonine-protein phosphatase 6 regulatory ankyrin repeat subunit A-like [Pyrus x bretschneideri]